MALLNRDKDQSEQREIINVSYGTVATGVTLSVAVFPYPCQIVAAQQTAIGLSGTPIATLWLQRFVVGSGVTSIGLAATLALTAYGTSGAQGYSTVAFGTTTLAQGSTAVQTIYPGDQLVLLTSGSNAAVAAASLTLVIKSLQDIKTHFGV